MPRVPGHKHWPLYPLPLSDIALFKKAWPRFVPDCASATETIYNSTAQTKANMINHTACPHEAKAPEEEPHERGHQSPPTTS